MNRVMLTADQIGALIAGVAVRVDGIEICAIPSLELTRLDYIVGEYNNEEYWEGEDEYEDEYDEEWIWRRNAEAEDDGEDDGDN